jgi:hypothetical protein
MHFKYLVILILKASYKSKEKAEKLLFTRLMTQLKSTKISFFVSLLVTKIRHQLPTDVQADV